MELSDGMRTCIANDAAHFVWLVKCNDHEPTHRTQRSRIASHAIDLDLVAETFRPA